MNLTELRAAAFKAAQEAQKTMETDPSEDNVKAVEDAVAEVERLDGLLTKAQATTDALAALAANTAPEGEADVKAPLPAQAGTLGERFIKSPTYKRFAKQHPSGLGEGTPLRMEAVKVGSMTDWFEGRKDDGAVPAAAGAAIIGSPIAQPAPLRMPTIDLVQREDLTILDLVSRGSTTSQSIDYVQITAVSNNAAIVPENLDRDDMVEKPESDMETALATARAYTYADGYTVTNQLLSDAPAFASYMNTAISHNLDATVADKLLNGSGTGGQPTGILNTTGLQGLSPEGAGDMELVKAVRRGITKLRKVKAPIQAILVNPEDAEAFDFLQDKNDRFFGNGPWGSGPSTLWGRPVVETEEIEPGHILMGDFKQVALLDREGLSVTAFNQHKDYASHNLVYVRAELRAMQVVWRPSYLLLIEPYSAPVVP